MLPAVVFILLGLGTWLVVRNFGPPVLRLFFRVAAAISGWLGNQFDRHTRAGALVRREGSWRRWVPVVLILGVGLGLSMLSIDLFVDIAERLREDTSVVERIDAIVHQRTPMWTSADATLFFRFVTTLGDPPVLIGIVVVLAVWLWRSGHRVWATYLTITCGLGGLLNLLLKSLFERARPDVAQALRDATGYSFPSGHSMGSMVVYAAICWLSVRILPSWRKDSSAVAIAATLILAIGVSRIYLGVHWFSDVVGGFAAGLGWVATSTAGFEAWRQLRRGRTVTELLQTSGPDEE